MFKSYEDTFKSSSDFLRNINFSMATSSSKRSRAEEFKTPYTCEEGVTSFKKNLNLSETDVEREVILEPSLQV